MIKDRYEISLWEDYSTASNPTLDYYLLEVESPIDLCDSVKGEVVRRKTSGKVIIKKSQIDKFSEGTGESFFYILYRNSTEIPYETYRIGKCYWSKVGNNFTIYSKEDSTVIALSFNIESDKRNGPLKLVEHYEEKKIAVIGSDSMTAYSRAVNPQLVENINGTNTLTFTMYYTYYDENGIKQRNPFIDELLVNERKIKLFWKDKWYDFIIKNCQEDSSGKFITYTCQDLFINELSKTGFNIELDPELNNNQGQAHELAARVADQTDWTVIGPDGHPYYYDGESEEVRYDEEVVIDNLDSDIIQQESEEPVYEIEVGAGFDPGSGFSAYNQTEKATEASLISAGQKIYIFYNQIQNAIKDFLDYETEDENEYATGIITLQFLHKVNTVPTVNSGTLVINNLDCWKTIDDRNFKYYYKNRVLTIGSSIYVRIDSVSNYRGNRLVETSKVNYDPLTNKYCDVFIADAEADGVDIGDTIYKYTETKWQTPSTVNNLFINGTDFVNTEGWAFPNLAISSCPVFHGDTTWDGTSVLGIDPDGTPSARYVYNTGLTDASTFLPNGMTKGEKFVFRYRIHRRVKTEDYGTQIPGSEDKYGPDDLGLAYHGYSLNNNADNPYLTLRIHNYRIVDNYPRPIEGTGHVTWNTVIGDQREAQDIQDNWNVCYVTCTKSFSKTDIINDNIGLFISTRSDWDMWIEDIQFYPLVWGEDDEGNPVRIDPAVMNGSGIDKTYYTYYNHTVSKDLLDKDDIKYLYHSDEDWVDGRPAMTAQKNNDFEKIRSVNAKQSNRFNIIQSIAETFQCWARFTINHDSNGRVIYNEDGTPQKYITFKKEVGQETGIGFTYGIDLNTIKRTIQSNQIVTKTIVSPNANEFATNGFCTIARSELNPPRTNFVLNFDYYITQGMLDEQVLNNDLGLTTQDNPINYYPNMYLLNTAYDKNAEILATLYKDRDETKANYKVVDENLTAAIEQYSNLRIELKERAGYPNTTAWTKPIWIQIQKRAKDDPTLNSKMQTYIGLKGKITQLEAEKVDIKTHLDNVERQIKTYEEGKNGQKELTRKIRELDLKFYNKYSRFIQEGAWQSEQYIDDNLYYLDALSVAYTSSRPQVTYDISVIRLSSLDEYKNKVFRLGDISFIQDTEFFGYLKEDPTTPYKEKVLVSEITSYLDEPEKDVIRIQNFKTQFEDLFQRITATTQSLQYASGEYAKVASIITPEGSIKGDVLQNSIALNQQLVYSSTNDTIRQDATGITVTDGANPNRQTKLNSGGVFITNDGGATWKNAINGAGVATELLTAGKIKANDIMIYDGNAPTFRWDGDGIDAFYYTTDPSTGEVEVVDRNKFVRFDKWGVYGVKVPSTVPSEEQSSWEWTPPSDYTGLKDASGAQFGMTWDGFFMKSVKGSGYVEISNENAIKVVDSGTERIKIGAFGTGTSEDPYYYGIQISNGDGDPVLVTEDDGSLWLKDSLTVETSEGTSVQIGKLGDGQVINANGQFIVNEDGSIVATNATISGQISALSGVIGGWQIEDNRLASYRQLANGELELVAELNGSVGSLSLGDNLTLSGETSTIDAGGIIINGNESIITGQGDNSNIQYFSITPNKATFKNVDVSGKISTSVFETNKVQVVGGAMIFKPSFLIENVQNNSFVCEEAAITEFIDNYICFIGLGGTSYSTVYRIDNITSNNGKYTVTFTPNLIEEEGTIRSVLILGPVFRDDSNNELDTPIFTIAVNSNDQTAMFMRRRGLTMEETLIHKNGDSYDDLLNTEKVKVFVGALDSLDVTYMPSMQGYGFYSNNAYLEGSLVASQEIDDELIYTGINTLNQVVQSVPLSNAEIDDSPVILWGGAKVENVTDDVTGKTSSRLDIGNAPFQVTLNGSLYANNGLFEGSLITRSVIEASELKTAIIRGSGTDIHYPALRIYDGRNNGIGFFVDEDDDPQTADKAILYISGEGLHSAYLTVGDDGYYTPTQDPFIGLDDSGVRYLGNIYKTIPIEGNTLTFSGGIITGETIDTTFNGSTNISMNSNTLDFSITDVNNNNSSILSITKNQIKSNTTLWTANKFKLGNNVSFETVASGGFDIYAIATL